MSVENIKVLSTEIFRANITYMSTNTLFMVLFDGPTVKVKSDLITFSTKLTELFLAV